MRVDDPQPGTILGKALEPLEVGTGLIPASAMARLYRDLLGKANQRLAQHADRVYLMVAGLPLQVKP